MDGNKPKLWYSSDENDEGAGCVDPRSRLSFGCEDDNESDRNPLVSTAPKRLPSFVEMVVEAIKSNADKKGTSLQFIKAFCKDNYSVGDAAIKRRLKPAIEKCLSENRIARPKPKKGAKEAIGITGRFILAVEAKHPATVKNKTQPASQKQQQTSAKVQKGAKSVKEKSLTVKLAQSKVKQARLSLAVQKEKSAFKTRSAKSKLTLAARKFPVVSVTVNTAKQREDKSRLADEPPHAATSRKPTKSPKKALKENTTQGKQDKEVVKRKVVKESDKKATKVTKQKTSATTKTSQASKAKSASKAKGRPKKK